MPTVQDRIVNEVLKKHALMDLKVEDIMNGNEYDALPGEEKISLYRIVKEKSRMMKRNEA